MASLLMPNLLREGCLRELQRKDLTGLVIGNRRASFSHNIMKANGNKGSAVELALRVWEHNKKNQVEPRD